MGEKPYNLHAVLPGRLHDQMTSSYESFLIGQGDGFPGGNGIEGRFQSGIAYHGGQHRIDRTVGSGGPETITAAQDITFFSYQVL